MLSVLYRVSQLGPILLFFVFYMWYMYISTPIRISKTTLPHTQLTTQHLNRQIPIKCHLQSLSKSSKLLVLQTYTRWANIGQTFAIYNEKEILVAAGTVDCVGPSYYEILKLRAGGWGGFFIFFNANIEKVITFFDLKKFFARVGRKYCKKDIHFSRTHKKIFYKKK